ncbi:MAG: hypothetical protein H0U20_05600 [Thermoleophilaceae bacterium]|nr:hypothetical protein [Thermoleophilaceae bacterium]
MGLLEKLTRRRSRRKLPAPTYSNDAVIRRIEHMEGVGRETARAWFDEMLVFLDLCARSNDEISPPKEVDAAGTRSCCTRVTTTPTARSASAA